jgi:hypothetical protein
MWSGYDYGGGFTFGGYGQGYDSGSGEEYKEEEDYE